MRGACGEWAVGGGWGLAGIVQQGWGWRHGAIDTLYNCNFNTIKTGSLVMLLQYFRRFRYRSLTQENLTLDGNYYK